MRTSADRKSLGFALAAVISIAGAQPAAADENVAKADQLFEEGVKLRDSNPQLACAKFGESLELNPQAIGTLLNVAVCDEKQGRIASAVRRFREARERAVEQKLAEHLALANEKLAALSPEVPHLKLRFLQPPPPQTTVIVDDRLIAAASYGDLAVDPGELSLVVSAPGHISFQSKIRVTKGAHMTIDVPALAKSTGSARRTIGKLTTLGGAALTLTGVTLGYLANRRYDRELESGHCTLVGGEPSCNGDGHSAIKSARTLGNVGTVVGGVGLAAIITGGILWYLAPAPAEHTVRIVPQIAPDNSGVAILGRF